MAEYIEREAIEKFIEKGLNNPDKLKAYGFDAIEILSEVHFMPAADVAEVKRGEWIDLHDENVLYEQTYICSACGEWFVIEAGTPKENGYKYCPNCGARMDGEGE